MTQTTVRALDVQAAGGLEKWAAKAARGRVADRYTPAGTADKSRVNVAGTREITLELPWPPSVNHYWRHVIMGGKKPVVRNLISADGRAYKRSVGQAVLEQTIGRQRKHKPFMGRVHVVLTLYPPDRRQRDIDNSTKAVLDALTDAKVWRDDSQVDDLHITRGPVERGGRAVVHIREVA
jgi:crossover junction endodeoxyribonuclease RusA